MKFAAFILSLCSLLSTLLPCCLSDHCGELSAAQPAKEQRKAANDCPPFSTCSLLGTFIVQHFYTEIPSIEKEVAILYGEHPVALLSSYSYELFQPPRLV